MSADVLVQVPDGGVIEPGDKVPPIRIVTDTPPEPKASPSPPHSAKSSPSEVHTLRKVHPQPRGIPFRRIVKPRRRGNAPENRQYNTVQAFLSENPAFASEFSQTIPISPKIAESDPEDLPDPVPTSSRKRRLQFKEEEEAMEKDMEEEEEKEEGGTEEEEEEEDGKKKEMLGDDGEYEEEAIFDEDDPDGAAEIGEDEEEEEDRGKSSRASFSVPEEDESERIEHESDVFGASSPDSVVSRSKIPKDTKTTKRKPKQGEKPSTEGTKEQPLSEEEEAVEKMHLIEEIKGNFAAGLAFPQPPHYGMSLKLLRQIRQFQEDKAVEAMTMGLMGSGLVSIVGIVELLNGRFDPVGKVFGRGLKLQGAKETVEKRIDLYRVPFSRMYRTMKKKGPMDLPPWAQIVYITTGILKDVHTKNTIKEMAEEAVKEQGDPESQKSAQAIMKKAYEEEQARKEADKRPYHSDVVSSPQSDSELEATLAREFAGFDKLPSLGSIAAKRKDVMSSIATTVAPPPPLPPVATTAATVETETPPPKEPKTVELTHNPQKDADKKDANEDEDEYEDEDDEVEYDEEDGEGDAPIIQVPSARPLSSKN